MTRAWIAWLALALALCAPTPARAHSLAFGVLRVVETSDGARYQLRASGREGEAPDLSLAVSGACRLVDSERAVVDGLLVAHGRLSCPSGLAGARLQIRGLAGTELSVAVRLERGGPVTPAVLDAGQDTLVVDEVPAALPRYGRLGLEHIAGGYDHLAFLFALTLLVFDPRAGGTRRLRALAVAVTGFTAGHALTLTLATLGALTLPSAPVEACIALSIVALAAERLRPGPATLAMRRPGLVAAAFGLLHGLGFAGALGELGLPADGLPAALLGFNLGVELGQLLFVAALLGAGRLLVREGRPLPLGLARGGAWAVGVLATVWTVARVDGLLG